MVWRTAAEAEFDLEFIAQQGLTQFGPHASRQYIFRLIEMFSLLARHPEMGSIRNASRQTVRLMPSGAHHILYLVDAEDVIVLRVLHGLQDWFELL